MCEKVCQPVAAAPSYQDVRHFIQMRHLWVDVQQSWGFAHALPAQGSCISCDAQTHVDSRCEADGAANASQTLRYAVTDANEMEKNRTGFEGSNGASWSRATGAVEVLQAHRTIDRHRCDGVRRHEAAENVADDTNSIIVQWELQWCLGQNQKRCGHINRQQHWSAVKVER